MALITGLYYPHIHFVDDDWIKLAALFWDAMGRIVPWGYPMHDSDVVQRLAGELGFVRNFAPASEAADVSTRFEALLQQHGKAISKRYGLQNLYRWEKSRYSAHRGPWQQEPRLAYILDAKLSSRLESELERTNLGKTAAADNGGFWIGDAPEPSASIHGVARRGDCTSPPPRSRY